MVLSLPEQGRGPVKQVHSGIGFYPLDPRPEEVTIEDIAWHLAYINRFAGAAKFGVSVAAHSLVVEKLYGRLRPDASPKGCAFALLHDAAEAYIGDITRPVKQAIRHVAGNVLDQIERRILDAISARFGLWQFGRGELHEADSMACAIEREFFLEPAHFEWAALPPIPDDARELAQVYGYAPDYVRRLFLQRFRELTQ